MRYYAMLPAMLIDAAAAAAMVYAIHADAF